MPSKSTIDALLAFHGAPRLTHGFPIRLGIMKERTPLAQRGTSILRPDPIASRTVDTGSDGRVQPQSLRISRKQLKSLRFICGTTANDGLLRRTTRYFGRLEPPGPGVGLGVALGSVKGPLDWPLD